MEKEIERSIRGGHVVVHAEPCGPDCKLTDRCVLWAKQQDLLAHDPQPEARVAPPSAAVIR